jgi:hypothetical protein
MMRLYDLTILLRDRARARLLHLGIVVQGDSS